MIGWFRSWLQSRRDAQRAGLKPHLREIASRQEEDACRPRRAAQGQGQGGREAARRRPGPAARRSPPSRRRTSPPPRRPSLLSCRSRWASGWIWCAPSSLKQKGVREDVYFYGPESGWALRYLLENRPLCSLHVHDARPVGIVSLEAPAAERVDWKALSPAARKAKQQAHGSPSLLWLDVPLEGGGRQTSGPSCAPSSKRRPAGRAPGRGHGPGGRRGVSAWSAGRLRRPELFAGVRDPLRVPLSTDVGGRG